MLWLTFSRSLQAPPDGFPRLGSLPGPGATGLEAPGQGQGQGTEGQPESRFGSFPSHCFSAQVRAQKVGQEADKARRPAGAPAIWDVQTELESAQDRALGLQTRLRETHVAGGTGGGQVEGPIANGSMGAPMPSEEGSLVIRWFVGASLGGGLTHTLLLPPHKPHSHQTSKLGMEHYVRIRLCRDAS